MGELTASHGPACPAFTDWISPKREIENWKCPNEVILGVFNKGILNIYIEIFVPYCSQKYVVYSVLIVFYFDISVIAKFG